MTLIAQLSDLHFGSENRPALEGALERLGAEPPELAVFAGDLTMRGRRAEFEAARRFLGRLSSACLVTPGNHDAPYTPARMGAAFGRYERSIGPAAGQAFASPQLAAVAINTARGAQWRLDWSKGAITRPQARLALELLADAPAAALRVVVCHHPLVEMIAGPMSGRVHGGEAAARLFADGRIDLVLTGHVHAPFAFPMPYADGLTYAVGAGTLSHRERGAPPGFNLIEADADAVHIQALGWTGASFEPWRAWSLQRRAPCAATQAGRPLQPI